MFFHLRNTVSGEFNYYYNRDNSEFELMFRNNTSNKRFLFSL